MQIKKFIPYLLLLGLAIVPFISAQSYSGWGGGYTSFGANSPLYYLENAWVMFGIIFIIFFAVIYITINKSFKNPQASAVIAAGLALFISIVLAQRGWLDNYLGGQLGGWMILIAALIAIGFALKFAYESFGRIGAAVAVLVVWYVIHNTDPYQLLPNEILNDAVMQIYDFLASVWGGLILLVISAIIITARSQRKWTRMNEVLDSSFGGR